jgi:hypothetical protein
MEYKVEITDALDAMEFYSDDGYNLLSAEVLPKEKLYKNTIARLCSLGQKTD